MYSTREIARAAGVPEARVRAALGGRTSFLSHAEAVALGRRLVGENRALFSIFEGPADHRSAGVPFAVSSTLHAAVIAATIFIFTFGSAPVATSLHEAPLNDPLRLVFLNTPGPGGGGGGGGLMQKAPPPKA